MWQNLGVLYSPTEVWEFIQLGNCGAPIETPEGWLVITHGVGPLRTYCLGALLLDLENPMRVIARTVEPLLRPEGDMVDGYVPRVVYSCGGILHRGTLWIPVGIGDSRVRVYSTGLEELRQAMSDISVSGYSAGWGGVERMTRWDKPKARAGTTTSTFTRS